MFPYGLLTGSFESCKEWICYDENYDEIDCGSTEVYSSYCEEYDETLWYQFQQDFNIPFAGYRDNGDSIIRNQGVGASLWSSSPTSHTSSASYEFDVSLSSLYTRRGYRAGGNAVRCFKDDYLFTNPSMNVVPNGWTWAMILVEWDTIKTLSAPKKDKYVFKWWYSTSEFTAWSEITTWSTAPTNLYAKWEESKDIILEATSTSANQTITKMHIQ